MKKLQQKFTSQRVRTERLTQHMAKAISLKQRNIHQRTLFTEPAVSTSPDRHDNFSAVAYNLSVLSAKSKPLKAAKLEKDSQFLSKLTTQTSDYLANKFKKYAEAPQTVKKRLKSLRLPAENPLNQWTVNLEEENNNSVVVDSLSRIYRHPRSSDKCFLKNAREKIMRLIDMKSGQQKDYQHLQRGIKTQCLKAKKNFRVCQDPMPQVEKELWDQEWKRSVSLQLKRYRTRVLLKNVRNNKLPSLLTQL